jgi:hypothetical protein
MNHSYQTDRPSRRAVLTSGISLLGFGMALAPPFLFSGCGDEKGAGMVENPEDPAQKAKDSMSYYRQQNLKDGKPKKSAASGR